MEMKDQMEKNDLIASQAHIGIRSEDVSVSRRFYEDIGFSLAEQALQPNGRPVIFMTKSGTTLEIYEPGVYEDAGALDHIAFNTVDIDACYEALVSSGYRAIEGQIMYMDLGYRRLKYFTINGPYGEKIEFCMGL